MTYLKHIDGLRALSVLAVIFFHFDMFGMSGGFVGVDVFFVISGFLITGLIIKDIERGTFSITGFWARRFKRIIPAFVVVVVATLAAAWFILLPLDFVELSQSARWNAFFASNIFFWKQTGYFNTSAELLPLLHTWSLAVEMQFYIFYPFFVYFLARKGSLKTVLIGLSIVCALSFILNVVVIQYRPAATFYLLPTRGWELGLGGLAALMLSQAPRSKAILNLLAFLGLAAIVAAVFSYHEKTVFPGFAAVLPAFGAALIIWTNAKELNLVGRLLSITPLVWIGLLSYSLYLWHWPLISLARHTAFDVTDISFQLSALLLAFILAWLSWKFVEGPCRRWIFLGRSGPVLGATVLGLLTIFFISSGIQASGGFPQRLSPQAQAFHDARQDRHPQSEDCHDIAPDDLRSGQLCRFGPSKERPDLVSFGDSHSDSLLPLVKKLAEDYGISVWHASRSSCPPLLDFDRIDKGPDFKCPQGAAAFFDLLEKFDVHKVLIASNWRSSVGGRHVHVGFKEEEATDEAGARRLFEAAYRHTFAELEKRGVSGWVVEQTPFHKRKVPDYLARLIMAGEPVEQVGAPYDAYQKASAFVNKMVSDFSGSGFKIIYPKAILCSGEKICVMQQNGQALYRDGHHLSMTGAYALRPVFEPIFQALSESQN